MIILACARDVIHLEIEMGNVVTYDSDVHGIIELRQMLAEGNVLVCPQCQSPLIILVDANEARENKQLPGVYCPLDEGHVCIRFSPVSLQIANEIAESSRSNFELIGASELFSLSNRGQPNSDGLWQELQLSKTLSSRFVMSVNCGQYGKEQETANQEIEIFDSLDEAIGKLERDICNGQILPPLLQKLQQKIKELKRRVRDEEV